jgi:hypothetical protein
VQPTPIVASLVTPHARAVFVRGLQSRYASPCSLRRGDGIAPAAKGHAPVILTSTLALACALDTAAASRAIDSFQSRAAMFVSALMLWCLNQTTRPLRLLLLLTTFPLGCSLALL